MKEGYALTMVELLVAVCIIFIFMGSFAIYANLVLKTGRELALRNELTNIRMSIEHYRIINGSLPQDLSALMNKGFTMKLPSGIISKNNFLEPFRVSQGGDLLDPFMNRYYYDTKEGRVSVQTKGYQSW